MSLPALTRTFRRQRRNALHILQPPHARIATSSTAPPAPSEHRVVLDGQTLYIDRRLAAALGWTPEEGAGGGVALRLRGWGPAFFAIAPAGSESDRLARAVVESGRNPAVKRVLEYLKER